MAKIIQHPWANGGDNSGRPEVQLLDNGHLLITADADTDADGSPDAEDIDNSGQRQTSLSKDNGWKGEGNYVNSCIIPYFVLPLNWQKIVGVKCRYGDIAKITYGNALVYAIYADAGPETLIGEASIAAVEALGHNPWNEEKTKVISGIPHGVRYEIIPQSSNLSQTVNYETIQAYGKVLFGDFSAADAVDNGAFVTWLELNRAPDGTPAITAYAGSEPKYTRFYRNKQALIGFLEAFPNAQTALVAHDKPIPACPDYKKNDSSSTHAYSARQFASYFQNHYAAVRREVERWFIDDEPYPWSSNAVTNGCVAHQVSCLHLCKFPHPELDSLPSVNVDRFVEWALAHAWKKIEDMEALQAGDICVSGSSASDLDHVYCFVDYIDPENAHVLHNQVFGLASRSLIGRGCGRWRFALRMP